MQGMSAWEFRKDVVQYSNPDEYERMIEQENTPTLLDRLVATIKKAAPTAISTANAALAQLSYSGSTGNFQSASETITIGAKFQPIVEQYPEQLGSPLCKRVYLNTLNGYIKCENAIFAATGATSNEEAAVEAFLNGGFFYE